MQNVNATEFADGRIRLSGFGTLGLTHAGTNRIGFRKDLTHDGQFGSVAVRSDSVFGLQLDADILPKVSATVQAIAKESVRYDFQDIVDWAYLSYQAAPNFRVRGGRMAVDLYMLSEYRNVAFAYLWTHPVIEFYAPLPFTHFDGMDFKYTHSTASGNIEFKIFGGYVHNDVTVYRGINHVELFPLVGANVVYDAFDWKMRISFATAEVKSFKNPLDPLLNPLSQMPTIIWPQAPDYSNKLSGDGKRVNYLSAGYFYDKNKWIVQAEVAWAFSNWELTNMFNGYVSAGRRFGPFTIYSTVSGAKTLTGETKVTRPLLPLSQLNVLQVATQTALNAARIDQRTFSLGARWDIHPQVAIKAQWDHTWIGKHGGLLLQNELLDKNTELDIFSLNLSFIF
ncbi:MAG: hypothetical protein KDF59_13290 [Nitrosomonas sp.]|nr:hypothetical protein [Nitrosomonas sp.]